MPTSCRPKQGNKSKTKHAAQQSRANPHAVRACMSSVTSTRLLPHTQAPWNRRMCSGSLSLSNCAQAERWEGLLGPQTLKIKARCLSAHVTVMPQLSRNDLNNHRS